MKIKYPLISPDMPDLNKLLPQFEKIWKNNIFSNNGPFVKEFENKIANYYNIDASRVCTCSSGTMGLILAIKSLKWNKQVLTPSYTFPATTQAIQWNNLEYSFIDIHKEKHYAMEKEKFDLNFFPVLPYGFPFIEDTSKFLSCIVDAASAFGSKNSEFLKILNSVDAVVCSLHVTKTMGVGEGGLVIFKDKIYANRFRKLANFGFTEDRDVIYGGMNGKMSEIMAAIGIEKLKNIENILEQREKARDHYKNFFDNSFLKVENHPWQIIPLTLNVRSRSARDAVRSKLLENHGIMTGIYYEPVHYTTQEQSNIHLPNTDTVSSQIISLPVYSSMDKKDVEYICTSILKEIKNTKE